MRQKKETATSFNKLKEITQAMQAHKNSAQTSDNANISELAQKNSAQTSDNANISEITRNKAPKPKGSTHAKNSALQNPQKEPSASDKLPRLETTHRQALKKAKGGVNA